MSFPLLTAFTRVTANSYAEFGLFQPDKSSTALERRYANEDSEFVQLRGARVHYRDEGPRDGPTVVALHGAHSSLHTWDGWVERLGDRVRIVRLDMPGFGLTGPREGEHTVAELVRSVGALCDRLELTDVSVAGNSLGGTIAWRLAVARPELVSRLLLLNAGGAALLSVFFRTLRSAVGPLAQRYATPRTATRLLLRDAYGDRAPVTEALVRRYHDLILGAGNRAAAMEIARNYRRDHFDPSEHGDECVRNRTTATMRSDPVWDRYDISTVEVPALFQWGSDDSWLPESFGRRLARRVGDSQFITYDGVGHMPMEEAPEATAADAVSVLSS